MPRKHPEEWKRFVEELNVHLDQLATTWELSLAWHSGGYEEWDTYGSVDEALRIVTASRMADHDVYERAQATSTRSQPMIPDEPGPPWIADDYDLAMSYQLAEKASHAQAVEQFRSVALAGRLLSQTKVLEWAERQSVLDLAQESGGQDGPRFACSVTPSAGSEGSDHQPEPQEPVGVDCIRMNDPDVLDSPQPQIDAGKTHPDDILRLHHLTARGSYVTHMTAVPPVGVLRDLKRLSGRFGPAYGWTEAQTATFVLTGRTPLVKAVSVGTPGRPVVGEIRRVSVTAVMGTAAERVAAEYKRVCSYFLPESAKTLTARQAALLRFVLENKELKGRGLLRAWNAKHPEWRYKQDPSFSRAVKEARERLLECHLPGQRTSGENRLASAKAEDPVPRAYSSNRKRERRSSANKEYEQ